MEIRRTFIISLLLHITFSALLLLSVRSQGESGKMFQEKVFYIDLRPDTEKPAKVVIKDALLKKPAVKKIRKEPVVIVEKRKTGFTESLPIYSEDASSIAKVSDITFPDEKIEYENSGQDEKEIIVSSKTADDKRGGLFKAAALKLISAAIERAKTYPSIAKRRGIEGTVIVSFIIGHGGEPGEFEVLKSSGYKILDEATLKVVKRAAPYPYIDSRVEIPVTYRLKD